MEIFRHLSLFKLEQKNWGLYNIQKGSIIYKILMKGISLEKRSYE